MIDFSLTEEQKMLRQTVHDFSLKEIRPNAMKWDREPDPVKSFDLAFEVTKKGFQLGFGKIQIPEKYGGYGGTNVDFALVCEELAWGDAGVTTTISACHGVALLLAMFGSEEVKKKWLIPYCEDETGDFLMSGSMTEPEGGSEMMCPLPDPSLGMKGRATLQGEEYVLNATRVYCSSVARARLLLITLRTDPTKPNKDSLADFLVPMDTPGVTVGAPASLMGFRGSLQSEVYLDNVRLPRSCYLSRADINWGAYMTGGIKIGARSLGIARAAYEVALDYATQRKIWGQRLRDHGYMAGKLAEMKMKIEASRSLLYRTAWALDHKEDSEGFFNLLPMTMIHGCQTLREVVVNALDILGTYGVTKECAVEKYTRDAMVLSSIDGGVSLQRIFLAQRL
jgi:alkylation response protein AidB-like acyl-CoA dehydrogenase